MSDALIGRSCQFRSRSSLSPWNNPASTSTRVPFDSTRYFDPVTVRAAPRNVTLIIDSPLTCRNIGLVLVRSERSTLPTRRVPPARRCARTSPCRPTACAPDSRDQAGHGLRRVGGIHEQRLGPRTQLDGFFGGRRRNTVSLADELIVDLNRGIGQGPRRRADEPLEVEEQASDRARSAGAGSSALMPMTRVWSPYSRQPAMSPACVPPEEVACDDDVRRRASARPSRRSRARSRGAERRRSAKRDHEWPPARRRAPPRPPAPSPARDPRGDST